MQCHPKERRRGQSVLALADKYDDIKKLIDAGKEKGYLTYDQVNDLLPNDVHSPEDLDDLLTTIGTQGIDVLEGPKMPGAGLDKKFDEEEAGDDVELDLTPGALEKANGPVRMYLREMGTVPLLTREGEVEIAKRIELGQTVVLKALSRSPLVIQKIIGMGEEVERGALAARDLVQISDPLVTDETFEEKKLELLAAVEEVEKLYRKVQQGHQKLL